MKETSGVRFGVYLGPTGKLKVLEPHDEKPMIVLDEGSWVSHRLFPRIKLRVVKEMSRGWPVFNSRSDLKDYEYLGEL